MSRAVTGPRNRHDQPVRIARFTQSVERRKILLGLTIPASLALRLVNALVLRPQRSWPGRGLLQDSQKVGWANLALMVASAFLWIMMTLAPNFDHPRYTRHRHLVTAMFFTILLSLLTYPLPSILYIISTHKSTPMTPWKPTWLNTAPYILEVVAVLLSMWAIGTMRRGPQLYFEAPKLTIGYGWSMEAKSASNETPAEDRKTPFGSLRKRFGMDSRSRRRKQQGIYLEPEESTETLLPPASSDDETTLLASSTASSPKTFDLATEPVPNVLDYYQCSIFGLIIVAYIFPLARLATKRPDLHPDDPPQMPETLRAENVQLPGGLGRFVMTRDEWVEREQEAKLGLETSSGSPDRPKMSEWGLLKAVCAGQGWLIFTCKSALAFDELTLDKLTLHSDLIRL